MSSFFKSIKICLDRKLKEIMPGDVIVFENQDFNPNLTTGYFRPTLIPGSGTLIDLNGSQEEQGIYQIDMVFPANQGLVNILDKADELFRGYRQQELEHDGTVIYIREVTRLPFFKEGAKIVGAVQVNYVSYSEI